MTIRCTSTKASRIIPVKYLSEIVKKTGEKSEIKIIIVEMGLDGIQRFRYKMFL